MTESLSRREALKRLSAVSASLVLTDTTIRGVATDIMIAGSTADIGVASLSPTTIRLTIRPLHLGQPGTFPVTGQLAQLTPGRVVKTARDGSSLARVPAGNLVVKFTDNPPSILVLTTAGKLVQRPAFSAL